MGREHIDFNVEIKSGLGEKLVIHSNFYEDTKRYNHFILSKPSPYDEVFYLSVTYNGEEQAIGLTLEQVEEITQELTKAVNFLKEWYHYEK